MMLKQLVELLICQLIHQFFSGDMNLVGYSEQYYTIVNGTISDTVTFGNSDFLTGTTLHWKIKFVTSMRKKFHIHGIR